MQFGLKRWNPVFLIIGFSILLSGGCKKNSGDTGLVVLNIFPRFGSDSLLLSKTYSDALGRNISFSRAEYYISDIYLVSTSGNAQPVPGVLLVNPQTTQYIIGSVPTGSYKSIQFSVGVDASMNHNDPNSQPPGSVLAAQSPESMHFANDTLGYIFLALQGLIDTSAAGTGTPNTNCAYFIGTDSLFKTVMLPDHSVAPYNAVFNASSGKVLSINLLLDFKAFLGNLDVKANPGTMTTDFPIVADTLAVHVPGMFSYEQ